MPKHVVKYRGADTWPSPKRGKARAHVKRPAAKTTAKKFKPVPYVRHAGVQKKFHKERMHFGVSIPSLLSMRSEELFRKLRADGILPKWKDRRVLTAALESLEDFILWKADDLGRTSAQSRAAASTCSLMISTPFSSLFLAKAIHLWRTRQLSYAVLWQVYQSRQSPSFWRWTTNLWNASSKTSRLPVISTSGRRRKPSSKQSEMGWCRGWRGWCGQGSGDGSEKGSLGAVGRPRGTWTSRHTSAFQAFSQDNCQSITWTRSNHQARLEACGQEVPWGKRCHFAYWWS